MKLSTKLIGAFAIVLVLLAVTGLAGIMAMRGLNANVHEIMVNWLPSIKELGNLGGQAQEFRRFELAYFLEEDQASKQSALTGMDTARRNVGESDARYTPMISSPEENSLHEAFKQAWAKYLEQHKQVLERIGQGQEAEARLLCMQERAVVAQALETIQKDIVLNGKGASDEADKAKASYESGMAMSIVLFVVALVVTGLVAVILIRGVARQLGEDPGYLHEVASKIAAGDLDVRFKAQRGEGGVYAVLRSMVDTLKQKIAEANEKSEQAGRDAEQARVATAKAEEAMGQAERAKAEGMLAAANKLEGVVEIVTSASEELSAQIEQSSRGSEQQAQRVGETATAMEEMNATVLEVAKNASQAAETSDKAKSKAEEGAAIVREVVQGIAEVQEQALGMKADMTSLGQQAQGIGQIMNVISDIADQTNLLALNAAIEAARAGEAGRGFAVVADEVRKLAEKTMTATKEVGDAIQGIQNGTQKNIVNVENTVRKIDGATELAGRSGAALGEIVSLVDMSTDQVRSIATASEEQSAASEEINRSIEDVNRISAETSDAMRQSAQAVGELANQAQVLKTLVEELQAEGGGSAASTQRALAPGGGQKRLALAGPKTISRAKQ